MYCQQRVVIEPGSCESVKDPTPGSHKRVSSDAQQTSGRFPCTICDVKTGGKGSSQMTAQFLVLNTPGVNHPEFLWAQVCVACFHHLSDTTQGSWLRYHRGLFSPKH